MDFIFIRELRLDAWVGLYKHEKLAPQTIELDIEIAVPGPAVFASRRFDDTIDYSAVVARVRELLDKNRFGLVENLADRVANMILAGFPTSRVKVSIVKLGAVREARRVGVTVERSR